VGRGREVILEGGERPGEERPIAGVNNAGSGERIHAKLTSSELRHRKMGNGREDSAAREGGAATGGEKPLKEGCPWTNRSETWSADPRRETNRTRQTRSVGTAAVRQSGRPRERGWECVGGTRRRRVPARTARAETVGRSSRDAAGAVIRLVFEEVAPVEEPDRGVLRESGVRVAADEFRTRRQRA